MERSSRKDRPRTRERSGKNRSRKVVEKAQESRERELPAWATTCHRDMRRHTSTRVEWASQRHRTRSKPRPSSVVAQFGLDWDDVGQGWVSDQWMGGVIGLH